MWNLFAIFCDLHVKALSLTWEVLVMYRTRSERVHVTRMKSGAADPTFALFTPLSYSPPFWPLPLTSAKRPTNPAKEVSGNALNFSFYSPFTV